FTQKWSKRSGSRAVMWPATPSSNRNREKRRNAAARRCLRCSRSSWTESNCGGSGSPMSGIWTPPREGCDKTILTALAGCSGPAGWARPRSAHWDDPGTVEEGRATREAELAHWGLRVASYLVDFVAPFVAAGILVRVWGPAGVVAYVVAGAFVVWNLVVQGI